MDEPWNMEFVSEGSLQVTGHKPEELIKNRKVSFLDLIHPEDRDQVKRKMDPDLLESSGFSIEYRLIVRISALGLAARTFQTSDGKRLYIGTRFYSGY
ncbi:MAG: PAS domain-containing protein [Gammaproteobacteria bacterium]